MRVRIRRKPKRSDSTRHNTFALACAALLMPAALLAFTLAFWGVAADLHWTGEFFISRGLFSHWQVWLFTSAVLVLGASALNRWGDGGDDTAPL
jgi:hypothetical protein